MTAARCAAIFSSSDDVMAGPPAAHRCRPMSCHPAKKLKAETRIVEG
jgi:hypothetical protein